MNFSSRTIPRLETVVAGLIILTVTLLFWQHFGMARVLEFSAASGRPVNVLDDRLQQGSSVATLTRQRDALVLDCTLRTTVQWPYCQLIFPLSQATTGMDLSAFDSISVDLSYRGPGDHVVRMNLRNFEPGLSTADDYLSQKIIEVQFHAPAQGVVTIPIKVLRTAPWWIEQRNIPLPRTDMRIDNVTAIDLSIGAGDSPGQHQLTLRALKFHGKLISQNQLLMVLIGTWIMAALVWLGYTLAHYRSQLHSSAARLVMLSRINAALELEASELADQVCTDALTGALNRQGLRDALMRKWQQPAPSEPTMAVLFVDLDHFKRINDTHGHAAGDDVLRAFTTAMREEIRASDRLVRWGGEEFLIVCPGTGPAEAQALAHKLRTAIHQHAWPCGLRLTASFGVTALKHGEDLGEAIKRADGALYQAKANGRDCVEVA
jgi:diguanylate cyclase (GGDEF)-like protein